MILPTLPALRPSPVERLLRRRALARSCVLLWSSMWGKHARLGPRFGGGQKSLSYAGDAKMIFDETISPPLMRQYPANVVPWGARQERARTNLITQSDDFTTTWANTRSGETANAATAPDGTQTADKIWASNSAGTHKIRFSITKAASAIQYVFELYVLADDYSKCRLEMSNGNESASAFAHFDLAAETSADGAATTFTLNGHGIRRLPGTNWFHIWMVATTDTDTALNCWLQLQQTGGATSWTGTNADGLFAWGASCCEGNIPGSRIATAGSTGAKAADALRLVDANLFGPCSNAGALFAVFDLPYLAAADLRVCALNNGDDDTDNYAAILVNSSAAIRGEIKNNAGSQVLLSSGVTQAAHTRYAAAVSWGPNYHAAAANGVGLSQGTGGGIVGLDRLEVGGLISTDARHGGRLYGLACFDRSLSADELRELTLDASRWKFAA